MSKMKINNNNLINILINKGQYREKLIQNMNRVLLNKLMKVKRRMIKQ